MRLTPLNTSQWLSMVAGEPDADGTYGGMTAEDVIHDETYRCIGCEGRFTTDRDVEEVEMGFICEECDEDGEGYDGSAAGMLREHGTWSV